MWYNNAQPMRKDSKADNPPLTLTMKKRIWLSAPAMCGKEMEFIKQAFEENWIAPLGSNVNAFEAEMCEHIGAKHAVAMVTGTSAIHLALKYLGVGTGDIVTTSGGGMLICPDEDSKRRILKWITQSRDEARHYEHSSVRLMEIWQLKPANYK